ncbi:helix-turn-helix domain-containing protein [Amycolatopsis sp. cmx-4-68]|uniref:helix-turn-helix domain-containing protein n=1 Tax=Amycolatopsis sp. cmx-4-68 TaxID=2790938 RepID=UPI00397D43A8
MDVISTMAAPVGERFAFWREVNTKLWAPYDLRCDPEREDRFQAQVAVCEFGSVQATLMTTVPHAVHRTPKLIRRADPEMFKLGCFVRGGSVVVQDGQCAEYGVGDLKLYDTSRPFGGEFAPDVPVSQLLLLRFPRSLLSLPGKHLRQLSASRIPGAEGVGALCSHFLLHLAGHLHELGPADAARLSNLAVDVLTAALAHALDADGVVPPHTRQRALLARIRAFIRQNLGDAGLTPEVIAAAHHISVRYLHSLFHRDGDTVGRWIRLRRLEQCCRELAEPHLSTRPVNAIAARWGFRSAAHFSQVFRATYGMSPSEFRRRRAGHGSA